MKRSICVILVIVGLLSILPAANAAQLNEDQQTKLFQLGIMSGDTNGDLRLSDPITRAEAAKMICIAGGLDYDKTISSFADVSPSHWAYPYIGAAQVANIIFGDENARFYPDSQITNEEIVKMIVCLLGYGEKAEHLSGYPAGYSAVAADIGITAGLKLKPNVAAIRSDVGLMLLNALEIPVMMSVYDEEDNAMEYLIMDGMTGNPLKTLRETAISKKYDTSRNNIDRLSKAFASRYPYHEGDTEKSFALYPQITYTSGLEKTADGTIFECPAIYDDAMAQNLLESMERGNAGLILEGTTHKTPYAIYNSCLLVPVKAFQLAGCELQFDKASYVAAIGRNATVLEIMPNLIGMRKNRENGFWVPLEVCARFIDDTLYVPAKAVADELSIDVIWDSEAKTIELLTR